MLVTIVSSDSVPGGGFFLLPICPQQLQGCSELFSFPKISLGGFCFAWSN